MIEEIRISETLYNKLMIARVLPGKDMVFWKGRGCNHCQGSGYSSRLVVSEVLVLSPAVKKRILSGSGEMEIKSVARAEGMKTMREDALLKASRGQTTLEEVVRVTAQDES